jgi:ubiquinone/menaquinone biosynthesis C-methylase UbiE
MPSAQEKPWLPRVVEPELMDEDEQARAYSEGNFATPHDRFVELLAASSPSPLRGLVLDLGCGPADVTVRVARRFPDAVLHGVDGSAAMLRYGKARVEREKLGARITLVQALLPRDRPPADSYPVVISNSLLHHLHDPAGLWTTVKRFGARGGHLFVMDLLRPASADEVDRLVAEHSQGEPDVLVRDFHASLCAAFTVAEVEAQLAAAGLSALHVDVVSDRHLTVSGTLP